MVTARGEARDTARNLCLLKGLWESKLVEVSRGVNRPIAVPACRFKCCGVFDRVDLQHCLPILHITAMCHSYCWRHIRIIQPRSEYTVPLFFLVIWLLWEELGLRVFENRILRKIFGPKWEEVGGNWRKVRNKQLHGSHFSPPIVKVITSRTMKWAGHVAREREKGNAYRILMGKPTRKSEIGGYCRYGAWRNTMTRRVLD